MSAISPTAHYTGHVWARNGLSHPRLRTPQGVVLYESLRPIVAASRALGGPSLEPYLLTRHTAIDARLERAIEADGITQVIEVAAGLSPRGWRFVQRYGDRLTYVEADLPQMAQRKREALEQIGTLGRHHRVQAVDALQEQGPGSLAAVAGELDPDRGLAVITEGLLGYLPPDAVRGIWRRLAGALRGFSEGRYISDVNIGELQSAQVRAFRVLLSAFVRGRVYLHFGSPADVRHALLEAGFDRAEVMRAAEVAPSPHGPGSELVHVLEASTTRTRA